METQLNNVALKKISQKIDSMYKSMFKNKIKEKIEIHCNNLVKMFMYKQKEDLDLKKTYIDEVNMKIDFELNKYEIEMKKFCLQKKSEINNFFKQKWNSFVENNYDTYWIEEYSTLYKKYKIIKENQMLHKQLCMYNEEGKNGVNHLGKILELQENIVQLKKILPEMEKLIKFLKEENFKKDEKIILLEDKINNIITQNQIQNANIFQINKNITEINEEILKSNIEQITINEKNNKSIIENGKETLSKKIKIEDKIKNENKIIEKDIIENDIIKNESLIDKKISDNENNNEKKLFYLSFSKRDK